MPRTDRILILGLIACLVVCRDAAAAEPGIRLLFTGDILLSRNVALELTQRNASPWTSFAELFNAADLVVGNLEGAVGDPSDCIPSNDNLPCFNIEEAFIPLLSTAGFKALSIENNHSDDLGEKGRTATKKALQACNLIPLSLDSSPWFFQAGGVTVGIIALNLVSNREGKRQDVNSIELRQKMRLARRLANLVMVNVHWGSELLDWPNRSQQEAAKWLIAHGADLIIGHHPHVIQAPEAIADKPVFFSLGNHLFDQKYAETKQGLVADCRIFQGLLRCCGITTQAGKGSFFPQISARKPLDLPVVRLSKGLHVSGMILRPKSTAGMKRQETSLEAMRNGKEAWETRPIPLAGVERARLDGKADHLVTLEWHHSPIDGETGLRPYVYSATPDGLLARWRGSALAWPLLDATILPEDERILCALHRGDSYLDLQPSCKSVRVAAYRWNGFGFSGVDDPKVTEKCRVCLEMAGKEE